MDKVAGNFSFRRYLFSIMKFAVCMLPAHYWHRFTVSPTKRKAWMFLLALLGGTALFGLVYQWGLLIHLLFL
jgi:hypothetical protein